MLNSRLGLFSAATSGCYTLTWHPFSRSYGVILPSSLTMVLSLALVFSTCLPVSVCGTGTFLLDRSFSRQHGINQFATYFSLPVTAQNCQGGFAYPDSLTAWTHTTNGVMAYPSVSLHLSNEDRWYRNLNLLSIAYAFQPRLRTRLTLSGRSFLRKP